MRNSILISLLILAVAGLFTWRLQEKISTVRASKAALVSKALAAGIPLGKNDSARSTRPPRVDKDAEAKALAADFIAFIKEMKLTEYDGGDTDHEMQDRLGRLTARILSLNAKQLETFIVETDACEESKESFFTVQVSLALSDLAQNEPEATLTILTRHPRYGESEMGGWAVSTAVCKIAERDPAAALDWMRVSAREHPGLIARGVKGSFVCVVAAKDLRTAFKYFDEFRPEDPATTLNHLAQGATTPEKRSEFVALLRERTETMPEGDVREESVRSAWFGLVNGLSREGFTDASRWLRENSVTAGEIGPLMPFMVFKARTSEKGDWIQWMGENLTVKDRSREIVAAMSQWTQNDYRAAGEWLAESPDGPAKESSVSAYATTVARSDPATATRWALTLPEGDRRTATMKGIYKNWPKATAADIADRETFRTTYQKSWEVEQ